MGVAAVRLGSTWARVGESRRAVAAGSVAIAAAVAAWLVPMMDSDGNASAWRALVVSELFVVAAAVAAMRRPGTWTGPLLAAFAVTHALGFAANETLLPWRFSAGLLFEDVSTVVLAVLMLTFPDGRLQRGWDRAVALLFVLVICVPKPFLVAWTPPDAVCATCPPAANALFLAPAPIDLAAALEVRDELRTALIGLVLVILAARFVRASAPRRRVMAPLVATAWLLAAKEVADRTYIVEHLFFSDQFPSWVETPNFILFAAIPVAYVGGIAQTRVTRSTVGRLVADLGRGPQAGPLRDHLARALGDTSLQVGFRSGDAYIDAEGRPVELPPPGSGAHVTEVRGDQGPLAVLIHDAALLEDPGLIEAVAGAARLALENERLRAQVLAQLGQVRDSRARIVEAADAERRRIERDLHDGAQQRLVSLRMALRLMRAREADPAQLERMLERAEAEATAAVEELRDLARGIHPAVLADDGLGAALESLADRSPLPIAVREAPARRLPAAVEAAAYFTCSEAVTNAAKHARATRVEIRAVLHPGRLEVVVTDDGAGGATLDGGTGLRGIADRVEALGGRLEVASAPGAGTRVSATLPVAA